MHNHGDRKSPKDRVIPLPNGRTLWLINGGDPNYLPAGMILQVRAHGSTLVRVEITPGSVFQDSSVFWTQVANLLKRSIPTEEKQLKVQAS